MPSQIKTYDGYVEILAEVKAIVNKEPLDEMAKDSLISKLDDFETMIGEIISGREEEAFQRRRDDRSN